MHSSQQMKRSRLAIWLNQSTNNWAVKNNVKDKVFFKQIIKKTNKTEKSGKKSI